MISAVIASSADGTKLLVADGGGNGLPCTVYTSTDSGVTWVTNNSLLLDWKCAACSADGNKFVLGGQVTSPYFPGSIYISPPEVVLNTIYSNNSIVFSWPTNANRFALQQNADLAGTNWLPVTNTPVITNGTRLVTLPATNSQLFFRLKQ